MCSSSSSSTNTHTTEAVVVFDYTKKHDNEFSLKMGDVITDVKQVCEPQYVPYMEQYNGHSKVAIRIFLL